MQRLLAGAVYSQSDFTQGADLRRRIQIPLGDVDTSHDLLEYFEAVFIRFTVPLEQTQTSNDFQRQLRIGSGGRPGQTQPALNEALLIRIA